MSCVFHCCTRVERQVNTTKTAVSCSLLVEEIDVGETEPRVIVSGLKKYVEADKLQVLPCRIMKNSPVHVIMILYDMRRNLLKCHAEHRNLSFPVSLRLEPGHMRLARC